MHFVAVASSASPDEGFRFGEAGLKPLIELDATPHAGVCVCVCVCVVVNPNHDDEQTGYQ